MDIPAGYTRVDLPRARATEVIEVDSWGFAMSPTAEQADRLAECFDYSRGRGIEVADSSRGTVGSLAAVHTSFAHAMRVPGGGTVPTAGLTWVAVHQGHRRRGLLSTMIDDHFARSLSRSESVSTLFAAEPRIYQRFGYGLAQQTLNLTLERRPQLRDVAGAADLTVRLESADVTAHGPVITAVQQRLMRPGTMVDPTDMNIRDIFLDIPEWRHGAEQLRILVVEDGQGPAGYALFARTLPESHFAHGTTAIKTWGAATAAASHRLFSVMTDLDLMTTTTVQAVPLDDPLLHHLEDVRSTKARVTDNLWVRILDVPAALEARTYAADCELTVEVADAQIADNHKPWHISVVDGRATVSRAERGTQVHVRLGIQELSAAYLGGVTLSSLAAAGLVEEVHAESVSTLSNAMRGEYQPVANISF